MAYNPTKFGKQTVASAAPKKIRIMAVDDEEDILMVLRSSLQMHGFEVDTFANSVEALSHYKANYYGLIILDVRMPGMNGFELYRKIRSLDAKVKVCFLTAFETYREQFRSLFPELEEVKCYIKKPITPTQLIKHVEAVLELK